MYRRAAPLTFADEGCWHPVGARGGILGRSGVSGQTAGVRVGGVLLALKSELWRRKGKSSDSC